MNQMLNNKRGCVFPMVIWSAFRMGQYRVNDHLYHAPQFIKCGMNRFSKTNVSFFNRRKCMGRWKIRLVLKLTHVCLNFDVLFWESFKECDTKAPGCSKLCTNEFFPFSPIALWKLQMLGVSLPIIIFVSYSEPFKVNNSPSHGPWVMA